MPKTHHFPKKNHPGSPILIPLGRWQPDNLTIPFAKILSLAGKNQRLWWKIITIISPIIAWVPQFPGRTSHFFLQKTPGCWVKSTESGGCWCFAKVRGCRHWSSQRLAATGDLRRKKPLWSLWLLSPDSNLIYFSEIKFNQINSNQFKSTPNYNVCSNRLYLVLLCSTLLPFYSIRFYSMRFDSIWFDSIYLSAYLRVCVSVYESAVSIYLPTCLSIDPSIHSSICLISYNLI